MIDTPKLIRFGLVGGTSGVALLGLTWLFVDGLQLQVILGSSIAVILTGMYNYSMQYYWTFSSDAPHGGVLIKYLLMCVGILVLNALVMYLGVLLLPVHYLVVQFIANVAVAIWSFTVGSLWVFAAK
jgi:putative flippase GtrA